MKSKPDHTQKSFILMRDGQVQALLPYSDDNEEDLASVQNNEEDLASVQNQVHPVYKNDLARLGVDLPRVFSYHLAWCGDVAQAQRQTEKTVDRCWRWIAGFHTRKVSSAAWMLRMASYARRTTREREASGWLGMASIEEPVSMADLSKLALLSEGLRRMPAATAEALVLTCFAWLNSVEAGAVLGVNAAKVDSLVQAGLKRLQGNPTEKQDLLSQAGEEAVLMAALEGLARAIQPDPAWMKEVQKRLLSNLVQPVPGLIARLAGLAFFR